MIENLLNNLREKNEDNATSQGTISQFYALSKPSNNQTATEKFRNSTKPYEEEKKVCLPTIIQDNNEKKLKHRVFIIEEILKTEENYMKILMDLIETVIAPCQELKYLTKEQQKEIFSNIETIAKFSERFLTALKSIYNNKFDPSRTLFGEMIVKMQPFFRFYYPYCINYKDSRKLIEQARKDNPLFNNWLKNIEMTRWDKGIDSILIEPIQRLPRYVLLMKELKKNTPNTHPDLSNIEQALKTFEELNNTVNKHMEEYLKTLKLFELGEKYAKNLAHELIDPKRKFLEEEAMTLITDGTTRQVVCYFLTDMILVTEHAFGDMKLLKYVHFDAKSYVYDIPNAKHYNYLFTIYGKEEGLTFILDSQESKSKIIRFINKNILGEIKSRQDIYFRSMVSISNEELLESKKFEQNPFIEVTILGTIKRGLEKLSPFIVYFVRITYGTFLTDLFVRYRELKNLDDYVKRHFPDVLIANFPKKKLFHQKTKTIEGRKFDIEKFLRVVFNSSAIKEKPENVLKMLNLPLNFYELYNFSRKNNCFFKNLSEIGEKLLRRFSVIRVLYDLFHKIRPIYSILNHLSPEIQEKLIEKEIEIELPDESKHMVLINKYTKALDLCYELSQKIGLTSWLDYKLVLEKEAKDERIIDDDEFVFKALNIDDFLLEKISLEEATFFDKLYRSFLKGELIIKEIFQVKFRLKWKKCIFLHQFIETADYTKDLVKLLLMVSQVFQEIALNKYDLSMNDYCLFASLFAFIKYGELSKLNEGALLIFVEEKIIQKIIPIHAFIQEKKKAWISLILIFWRKIGVEIEKIAEFNKFFNEMIEENMIKSMLNPEIKQKIENNAQKFKISDRKMLASLIVMKYINTSELYGTKTFITFFKKLMKNEDHSKKIKNFCKLIINHNSLKFYDEINKKIEEITLKKIKSFTVFPDFVEILVKDEVAKEKGFEIFNVYSVESIYIYRTLELCFQIEKLTEEINKSYVNKIKLKDN